MPNTHYVPSGESVVFLLVATGWNNKLVHLEALESISPVESQQNMFQRSVFAKVLPGLPRFRYSAGGHGNGNEQVVQGVVFTDLSMCEAGSPDDLYRHPFVMTRERVAHGPIYPKLAHVEYTHKRIKTCCHILRDGWECVGMWRFGHGVLEHADAGALACVLQNLGKCSPYCSRGRAHGTWRT